MARYSFHAATVSLNVVDTPLFYNQPRGPNVAFTVTYNQRDINQPTPSPTASSTPTSNLGPKWTFNWLSFVIDNPTQPSADIWVYVQGGGAEFYNGYNNGTYNPGKYSHAVLVRTSGTSYTRTLPDGSTETFDHPDNTTGNGRRVFLTRITDPSGNNSITFTWDTNFRLTQMTDAVSQHTYIYYDNPPNDIRRITSVVDPFNRTATFQYWPDGHLKMITDMGGLTSLFTYGTGAQADFITSLTTPYGTTNFRYDDDIIDPNNLPVHTRWLQATDPLGGLERVEYNEAPTSHTGIPDSVDPSTIPCGLYNFNQALTARNTFFWSKKAMTQVSQSCIDTPFTGCVPSDYANARLFHWCHSTEITYNCPGYYCYSGGIIESEKKPLEARIWYNYPGQPLAGGTPCPSGSPSFGAAQEGSSNRPSKAGRVLDDSTTQLYQYQYNTYGKVQKATDPVGRVTSYTYPSNNQGIDLLTVLQRNPSGSWQDPYDHQPADKIAEYTYDPGDPPHLPHTYIDAAGQTTTYSYDSFGEVLTVQNPRIEVTTYGYGDGSSGHPVGYLISITGPVLNGSSPVTSFTYDSANRVSTVRNDPDAYETTTGYDNLDRPTQITYPDGTNQQFQYSQDFGHGLTTILDLTKSKDRLGLWTTRHYNQNRQMDSITDPIPNRITQFNWCACGLLTDIIDANLNTTHFDYDVQSRIIHKTFAFGTPQAQPISYMYENTTSRLTSMNDAIYQGTNYTYFTDDDIRQLTYTGAHNPTPAVLYGYDPYYNRVTSVTSSGTDVINGAISYTYYPVTMAGTLGANRVQTMGGFFPNDTITYSYDQLGRATGQSIQGVSSSIAYDSLGREGASDNTLGHFDRTYDGVTPRLQRLSYPNTVRADYSYFGNTQDRRLQTLLNSAANGTTTLSQFDYTYDAEGEIQTLTKNLSRSQSALSLQNDNARQLTVVGTANQQFNYSYDLAANRYDVKTYTGAILQSESYYTVNHFNQLDTVSVNGGTPVPLQYDGDGNLTDDAAGKTYEWDAANRLVAINYTTTGSRTEFAYDGLGRRVMITEYGPGMTATIQPKGSGYTPFAAEPFVLPAGSYTLTFQGLNPATTGNANTALLDNVELNGALVVNGGFESPTVQNYQVAPTGSSWSYSGTSGIAANGSTLTSGNPPAPQGVQVAFIQNNSSLWQSETIAAGTYTLTFQAAQGTGNQTYQQLRVNLRPSPGPTSIKTFVWSGNTIAEERDSTGGTVTKRFFAEGEQRIGGSDAGLYYYTRDHLGSVREVTNTSGTLYGQYDYDAWGNPVVIIGKMQVNFGYTGHYFHQPSGLDLALYRGYHPTLGRWMSRDPMKNGELRQGANLYWYVANNPMSRRDPTGLAAVPPGSGDGGCGTRGKYDNWFKKIKDIFDKGRDAYDIATADKDDLENQYRALATCSSMDGGASECITICIVIAPGQEVKCKYDCENLYAQHCFH
jgi:RHS repeat-associated protein